MLTTINQVRLKTPPLSGVRLLLAVLSIFVTMGVLRPTLAADPPAKSKDGAAHDVERQMLAEAPGYS